MSPLGRGLASLIPRSSQEVEEEQDLFQQLEADEGDMDSDAFFAMTDGSEVDDTKVEVTIDEESEDSQPIVVEDAPMEGATDTAAVSPLAFSVQSRQKAVEKEEVAEADDEILFMMDEEGDESGDGEEEETVETELPGADEEPMAVKPKIFVSENRTSLLAHEAIMARQAREQAAEAKVKAEEMPAPVEEENGEILTEEPVEETEEDESLAENPVVPPEEVPEMPGADPVSPGEEEKMVRQPMEEKASRVASVMAAASSHQVKADDVVMPAFGEAGASDAWNQHEEKIMHVAIGDIRINPLQPRRQFNESDLDELRDSIDKHGILQPLVVRRLADEESGYELIAGERRLRAAKSLNWSKVPCVVRKDVKSDQSRLVYALIENIQRSNLNPVEEALAYQQLNTEYGLTHEEIGERVGKSRVAVTNAVRILQLPAEIQRGLGEHKITIGHAKAILMIPDKDKQIRFYRHLVEEGVTVRKAEIRARRIQRAMKINDPTRVKNRHHHPLAIRYTPPLEARYGYGAKIKYNEEKNRFDVMFEAHSEKDLDELVSRLMGASEMPEHDRDIIGDEE